MRHRLVGCASAFSIHCTSNRYYCVQMSSTIPPEHTASTPADATILFFPRAISSFFSANENETERNHFFHFPIQCGDGYDVFITHFFSRSFLFTQLQFFFSFVRFCVWVCLHVHPPIRSIVCRMAFFFQLRLLFRSFFFFLVGIWKTPQHDMECTRKKLGSVAAEAPQKKCTQIKWKFKLSERYESLDKLLLCTVVGGHCWTWHFFSFIWRASLTFSSKCEWGEQFTQKWWKKSDKIESYAQCWTQHFFPSSP